jgi:hypothetical protein
MPAFFKVLWRVNAVLVFVALVALLAFIVLFSKERISQPLLNYFVPPPAAEKIKPSPTYNYVLEKDLLIGADTNREDFEVYRLVRWGKVNGKPATPEAAATVNLLVTDKRTNSNKWLFQGFDRSIVGQEAMLTGRWIWREPEVDDDVPVELVVLRVIEADSNGDGALTQDDRQTLYIARFAATPPTPEPFLTADAIWFTMQKAKEFQVGYRDKGIGYLAVYALPDFKLVSQTKIEGMPK